LDLRGIDHRHEPDPHFRAALQRRVAAIMAGTDPGSVTEARDLATIDLEPTNAKSAPERKLRRVALAVLAAAAAVVAIALVATRDDDATPADQPSPTPTVTVPPTTPPGARPMISGEALSPGGYVVDPGTYFVNEVAGVSTPRIFATIGAGWAHMSSRGGWSLYWAEGPWNFMTISRPSAVYSDACHPNYGFHPGPVTTIDGLVAALTGQEGWADVTTPSDIFIDGYAGKAFQRTAPAVMSDCSTEIGVTRMIGIPSNHPDFRSWESDAGIFSHDSHELTYEPGEIETLWVLDLDGTVVVIQTLLPAEPTTAARAEFAAVLDSIRIGRA
jgi:hypothetical protein